MDYFSENIDKMLEIQTETIQRIIEIQAENVQKLKDEYRMDKKCGVCYENFISLSFDEYDNIIEDIKLKYGENVATRFKIGMSPWLCFKNRFICQTCRNNDLCFGCLALITNKKTSKFPDCQKIVMVKCPFCRTEKGIIPIGILYEIKLVYIHKHI